MDNHKTVTDNFGDYWYNHSREPRIDIGNGIKVSGSKFLRLNTKGNCPCCGKKLTKENSSLDHKLPKSKFPELMFSASNLIIICKTCNSRKSDRIDYTLERKNFKKEINESSRKMLNDFLNN